MPTTSTNGKRYIWAIEWNNRFANKDKRRGMFFYDVTLLPGVKARQFEKFIEKEAFPAVQGILTRAIVFGPQYLLAGEEGSPAAAAEGGEGPLDDSQVAKAANKLKSLATCTLISQFRCVLGPPSASEK